MTNPSVLDARAGSHTKSPIANAHEARPGRSDLISRIVLVSVGTSGNSTGSAGAEFEDSTKIQVAVLANGHFEQSE